MSNDDSKRVLYQLEGCPYCELAAEELDALGLEYETVWTDALHSGRNEVKRVSGQRAVPVLVEPERGVTMNESANIVAYLRTTYGDADSPDEVEASI